MRKNEFSCADCANVYNIKMLKKKTRSWKESYLTLNPITEFINGELKKFKN